MAGKELGHKQRFRKGEDLLPSRWHFSPQLTSFNTTRSRTYDTSYLVDAQDSRGQALSSPVSGLETEVDLKQKGTEKVVM